MAKTIAAIAMTCLLMSAVAQAGNTVVTLTFGGVTRSSILHVPAGYDSNKAYPLMLVFHGVNGSGGQMENMTGLDDIADSDDFFVAYPESVGAAWVLSGTPNDAQFSLALMQAIESAYHIDPTRIYAVGYSEGAGPAQLIAFCYPTSIAGIGNVGQNLNKYSQTGCTSNMPVTAVLFHGTADPKSPYNGYPVGIYSAMETATIWARISGCTNAANPSSSTYPDRLNTGPSVTDTLYTFSGCANGTEVAFYSITGGGHTWPGGTQIGKPDSQLGPTSLRTDASEILWETLSQHRSTASFAGVCGSANGVATFAAPSGDLCQIGIASAVSGGLRWSWTCSGYNGGAAARCSAPR
ncbi:MAG: hypothetical protein JSR21_10245 [Proteobacteria bacterium]|nr:hypothetical protein [Pseudomonadota bacterium]